MTGFKNFIMAVSLMAGVIIGAGIFVLPFIFSKVGFLAGIFYLAVFTLVFIAIHLMYSEIIIKTKGDEHRFAGYARIYFGKAGYYAAILMTIAGMFFVLTIYLALSVSFLPSVGLPAGVIGLILFWAVSSLPIFFNVKEVAILEFVSNIAIFGVIFLLFFFAWGKPLNIDFFQPISFFGFFLPFGAIFFSLAGRSAIPEVIDYFRDGNHFSLRQSIIWGTAVSAVIYVFFIYAVLALSGAVSEDAITGLVGLPDYLLLSLAVLALINLWNSYIVIGIDVKESLKKDIGLKVWQAGLIVVVAPLTIYFSGFQDFMPLINFTGGLFLGLEGIFIVLMWRQLKNAPLFSFKIASLLIIFSLAIGYQIILLFI
ncbi:MAG: hypothetical protein HYW34_03725 [Candidatus Brennerbacteria bacterium]|nr:hypothetical protein [Candidatus Brennerbacteria bacterium]